MWSAPPPSCSHDFGMAIDTALIVTDAPPLITLAAALSFDSLLYPALPVIVPDAVFHEATSAADKLGAQRSLDWYRAHTDVVRVVGEHALLQRNALRFESALCGFEETVQLGDAMMPREQRQLKSCCAGWLPRETSGCLFVAMVPSPA